MRVPGVGWGLPLHGAEVSQTLASPKPTELCCSQALPAQNRDGLGTPGCLGTAPCHRLSGTRAGQAAH